MINMIIIIMTHKVINANLFIALEFFYYTFRFFTVFFYFTWDAISTSCDNVKSLRHWKEEFISRRREQDFEKQLKMAHIARREQLLTATKCNVTRKIAVASMEVGLGSEPPYSKSKNSTPPKAYYM